MVGRSRWEPGDVIMMRGILLAGLSPHSRARREFRSAWLLLNSVS